MLVAEANNFHFTSIMSDFDACRTAPKVISSMFVDLTSILEITFDAMLHAWKLFPSRATACTDSAS